MQQKSSSQAEDSFFQEPPISTIPLQENSFHLKTALNQRYVELQCMQRSSDEFSITL